MRIVITNDLERYTKEENEYIDSFLRDEIPIDPKKAERHLVMTPEVFVQIFTPQKIRLLMHIKLGTTNIYQLAKELGRPYESVHRDMKDLKGRGIIKVRKEKRSRIPYLYTKVELPVFG